MNSFKEKLTDKLPGSDTLLSLLSAVAGGGGDLRLMLRSKLQGLLTEDGWVSRADYDALLARVTKLENSNTVSHADFKETVIKDAKNPVKTASKKPASKKR